MASDNLKNKYLSDTVEFNQYALRAPNYHGAVLFLARLASHLFPQVLVQAGINTISLDPLPTSVVIHQHHKRSLSYMPYSPYTPYISYTSYT